MDRQLAESWVAAVERPEVARELEGIYAKASAAIAERKPVCVQSGRCCHFEAYGHRLYVTGVEAAYTVSRVGKSTTDAAEPATVVAPISLPVIGAARARGDCPYLEGNLCTVHGIKPLACRTYFCDATAQEWQRELLERLLGEIKSLHERHGIAYRYGEWRSMLEMFAGA